MTDMKRKTHRSPKALFTIEAIYEATAQFFESKNIKKISTNKIAEKSGYSIGTLYRYFPNKERLMISMAYHERDKVLKLIENSLAEIENEPLEILIRRIVKILLGAFSGRKIIRKHLMIEIFKSGQLNVFMDAQDEIIRYILKRMETLSHDEIRPPSPEMAYVLSRSVMGVIRSMVIEDSQRWGDPLIEEELVQLIRRYISP